MSRWLVPLIVVPALLGGRASAQERVDLEKHFPGLVEAFDSVYTSLYRFDDFWALDGKSLRADKLAEWQAKWRAEKERAEGEIEKLRADPGRHLDFRMRIRLQRHHYFRDRFKRDEFRVVYDYPPFVIYVQEPQTEKVTYSDADVRRYGEWLQLLEETFRVDYAAPLGLEQHHEVPGYSFFLLDGRSEYDEYGEQLEEVGLHLARAHYDAGYRIAVTYQDREQKAQESDEMHAAMHEAVHALQHAYHVRAREKFEKGLPTPAWFNEGFAEFYAYRIRADHHGEHTVPRSSIGTLESFVRSAGEPGAACILPLRVLTELATYNDAKAKFLEMLESRGSTSRSADSLLGLLYRQSDLWMHYLHDGEGGKYRPAVQGYVKALLNGRTNEEALAAGFGDIPLSEVDAGFLDFLAANRLGEQALERIRKTRADLKGEGVIAADASGTFGGTGGAVFELDAELTLAAALHLAREGKFSAAHACLRDFKEAGELEARLARETERLADMVALRKDFLESLKRSGKKLSVEVDGEKLTAAVKVVEDDRVELGRNSLEYDEIEPDDVDGLSLAKCMRDAKSGYDAPWLSAYPYVLAGERKAWRKILARGPSGAAALEEDAEDDYKARLKLAPMAGAMHAVIRNDDPQSARAARYTLNLIADLRDVFGREPAVRSRSEGLRNVATNAAEVLYGRGYLSDHVHGEREENDDGTVRLFYAFDDPVEARDLVDHRGNVEGKVEGGSFRVTGNVTLRHVLDFEGPVEVTCNLKVPSGASVRLGVCDDRDDAYAGFSDTGALEAVDPSRHLARKSKALEWPRNRTVKVALRLADAELSAEVDGAPAASVDKVPLESGTVHLFVDAERPVELADLEIRGTVSAAFWDRARAAFVQEKLESLGF